VGISRDKDNQMGVKTKPEKIPRPKINPQENPMLRQTIKEMQQI